MITIYLKESTGSTAGKEEPIVAIFELCEENIEGACEGVRFSLMSRLAGKQKEAMKVFAELFNDKIKQGMSLEFNGVRYYLVDETVAGEVANHVVKTAEAKDGI